MIIFFEKATGRIIGSIEGRVHPPAHKAMWVGDKKKTRRLIIEWRQVGDTYQPPKEYAKLIDRLESGKLTLKQCRVDADRLTLVVK